ncbi:MAG: GNAT family N-acetyltransferase [Heteroscytonema crispum UTEX LB 1556]
MHIDFKAAELKDIDSLLIFMEEFNEVDNHPFNAAIARDSLTKLLNNEFLGRIWLIHHQNEAIGYIVLTFGYSIEYHGRDAFIDEFYIRKSHQRQGIGKQTLKFVEEVAYSFGVNAVHLEVERENTSAQELYRRIGFKDQNRYLMTKWLTNP